MIVAIICATVLVVYLSNGSPHDKYTDYPSSRINTPTWESRVGPKIEDKNDN